MPNEIIRQNLLLDFTDRTPQAVINANPAGSFPNGVSDVPVFLYTSLQTLLTGVSSGSPTAQFGKQIISTYGKGATVTEPTIEIQAISYDPHLISNPLGSIDDPSVVCAKVQILFRQQDPVPDANVGLIKNIMLRTQWLLDAPVRQRRGASNSLTVTGDTSVDSLFNFICYFDELVRVPDEIEAAVNYSVVFRRKLAFN